MIKLKGIHSLAIVCPVLEAIGCDNKALLVVASDRDAGVTDVLQAIAHRFLDKPNDLVADLSVSPRNGLFYSQGGDDKDEIPDGQVYIEYSEDAPGKREETLEQSVQRAIENDLSSAGADKLRLLLAKHHQIFK